MKRNKIAAVIMSMLLAVGMMAGCGNKNDKKDVVETSSTKAERVAFPDAEAAINVIAKDPVKVSEWLSKIKLPKGYEMSEAAVSYAGETVKVEEDKDPVNNKVFTVAKDKTFADKNNIPNLTLTFASPIKTASELKLDVKAAGKDKKEATGFIAFKVRVLPESIKPVKTITQNLKISESLKDYDFDVRAKNIAGGAEGIESIKVKKSDVKFGKAGHYTVTYEVKLAPENVDVDTDAEVVDKEAAKDLPGDEVVSENVKPDSTVEVETDVEVTDKKDDGVITDQKDTAPESGTPSTEGSSDAGSSSSGGSSDAGSTPDSQPSSGGSSSGSGGNASGGNSSGGGSSSSQPSAPAHTHSWKAHKATKNVWVPNIVTVTDYENRPQHNCHIRCSECGAIFDSDGACMDHQMSTGHGGAQDVACTHTTKVAVGTHTEDRGHNETQTYTDYEYCDCGATR